MKNKLFNYLVLCGIAILIFISIFTLIRINSYYVETSSQTYLIFKSNIQHCEQIDTSLYSQYFVAFDSGVHCVHAGKVTCNRFNGLDVSKGECYARNTVCIRCR